MKVNIFLDDMRYPTFIKNKLGSLYPNNWVLTKSYFDFIKLVDKNVGNINIVSFDHDLQSFDENGKEWTGKDAVDYLINSCIENNVYFPNWYVHTSNTCGRPNIIHSVLNYLKHFENKKYDWIYYQSGIINNKIIS